MALSPGRILYLAWHRPLGAARRSWAEGGPIEQWRTHRGKQSMIRAVANLPVPDGDGPAIELHLLTGARFTEQTAFCLWTFARQSGRALLPVLHDDGSLRDEHLHDLRRLFPGLRVVAKPDAAAQLHQILPADHFPYLHERWRNYPNIRKLTDPHLGSHGAKLVLDSDLLFFRRPDFLLDWLAAPDRPLHAVDCETSYGYERSLMERLAGAPIADLVNVGLTGLRSDALDWDRIEYFCRELIQTAGTHYYLEQALVAMLVAGRDCAVAPAHDYVTRPRTPEIEACRAVMHHYVADSKPGYFRHNWRKTLAA
jgi:hypothetical protein